MNGFFPEMTEQEVNKTGVLCLAHVGDAVYELLIRSMLCKSGPTQVYAEHKKTVALVNATAQAKAAEIILPVLSESETAIFKRGRNTKVNSVPHNANVGHYHAATGFEALMGWLYLQGKTERINELFSIIMEGMNNAT